MLSRGPVKVLKTQNLGDAVQRAPNPAQRAGRAPLWRDCQPHDYAGPGHHPAARPPGNRGLISRCRETKDRRMVMARITKEGLKLLAQLDEPVQENPLQATGPPGTGLAAALTELLHASRTALC